MLFSGNQNSGRKPNPKTSKPPRYCLHCGKLLPEDTHGGRDYCSDAHKQAAYRQRQAEKSQPTR